MGFLELMLLAVGLSMDALAVSICKGLAMDRVTLGRMVLVGLWFGGFQGLMPLLGWLLGSRFSLFRRFFIPVSSLFGIAGDAQTVCIGISQIKLGLNVVLSGSPEKYLHIAVCREGKGYAKK